MTETYTPGPWIWHGEDYRGDWGWQVLVDQFGAGIMCGQDDDGPCKFLKVDALIAPADVQFANGVHVRKADADLIKAAPDMFLALIMLTDTIAFQFVGEVEKTLVLNAIAKATGAAQ